MKNCELFLNTFIVIIIILLKMLFIVPKKKENDNNEIVHKWYTLGISLEKCMITRFLKVDVVLEDLIALGKELKIVIMDEFKWSEGLHIRYFPKARGVCCG